MLVKNFGIELEPTFTLAQGPSRSGGINDLEVELQYTLWASEQSGLAAGLEVNVPIGSEALTEDTYELEPFVNYVVQTEWGLSLHPRLNLSLPIQDNDLELTTNLGLLLTRGRLMVGTEITTIIEDETMLLLAPQLGVTLNDWFVGGGVQIPVTDNNINYNAVLRVIYELSFRDQPED